MKSKLNKAKLYQRNPLIAHEYEDNSLQYYLHKYNENKYYSDRNGYPAYKLWKLLNTKIRKLSDKFKDTYGINVGTDHPQCVEPSDSIIKYLQFSIEHQFKIAHQFIK